ncbi:MAG: polysaccharide deacetylase family protein [Nitrosarchaeum sp.]|nr:polysaccharide deacetylase family protein [Nitrosarchaeum sp.]
MGILNQMRVLRPDFRARAAFAIDFVDETGARCVPFGDEATVRDKLLYLCDHGYELMCHTANHVDMGGMTREQAQDEYDCFFDLLGKHVRPYELQVRGIAYPFGSVPRKQEVRDLSRTVFGFEAAAWGWPGKAFGRADPKN